MADDERVRASRAPQRLLKGTCSLIFEGQSFVPEGEPEKEYWLETTEDARMRLKELLVPLGCQLDFQPFKAEFYGTLQRAGQRCGHLGLFGDIAEMEEIVSVSFTRSPPRDKSNRPLGICGLIKRGRARGRARGTDDA